jgi:hypothetical protein
MNPIDRLNIDQLQEDTRRLIERSRMLVERSTLVQLETAEQADRLAELDQRTRAAIAEALRLQYRRLIGSATDCTGE